MKKRILLFCLSLLLVVGAVWALSACNKDKACAHEWKNADCQSAKTCTLCGATEGEKGDHVWNAGTVTKPFDCVTTGEKTYACTICNETRVEIVVAQGHTYTDAVVAPTCVNTGYTRHTCACGASYDDAFVDALDHDWQSEPTCAHDRTCSRCDTKEAALTHTYALVSETEAGCKTAATETYRCSGCEDEYTDTVAPAHGHDILGVTPTEKHSSGCAYTLVYKCNTCGEDVDRDTVYHHTYIASITRDATCKTDGEKVLTCADCGDKKTESVEKTEAGHEYNEGTAANGKRIDTCKYCGATKTVIVVEGNQTSSTNVGDLKDAEIKLDNASIQLDSGVVDSIGEDKNVVVSADKLEGEDRDGLGLSEEEMAQLGNNPVYNFTINDGTENISTFGDENYVTVTLPYTLAEGEDVDSIAIWFISENGELESIPAVYNNGYVTFKTNHFSYYTVTRLTPAERCALYGCSNVVTTAEPTCDAAGYTLTVCVRCHKSVKTEGESAIGHNYIESKTDADCKNDGKITQTCENCGHSYSKTVKSKGHDWKLKESVGVGCGQPGYKIYSCRVCEEEYTEWKPEKKHEYKQENKKDATCVEMGEIEHVCKHCEHSYKTHTPATGVHKYKKGVCVHCGAAEPGNPNQGNCTHEANIPKRLDLGAAGACEGAIYYFTCECGQEAVYSINEFTTGMIGSCDFDEDYEDEYEDEDGVPHYTLEGSCRVCGLSLTMDATMRIENCMVLSTADISFFMGDQLLLKGFVEMPEYDEEHEWEEEEIDLAEYGACEGVLYIERCKNCGKVYDFEVENDCEMDENQKTEDVLDQDGNTVGMLRTSECSVCGLFASFKQWSESTSCTEIGKGAVSIKMGETSIFAYEDQYAEEEHDYEFVFTKDGEACVNGWRADGVCGDCGKTVTYYGAGHTRDYQYEDLSDYGLCGGNISITACQICGEQLSKYISDYACSWNLQSNEENMKVYRCDRCGTEKRVEKEILEQDTCGYTIKATTTYLKGGEELVSFEDETYYSTHANEYKHEMQGTSCEDGVTTTITCKNCDYQTSITTKYHSAHPMTVVDILAHGGCGGTVSVYACACGRETYLSYQVYCNLNYASSSTSKDEEGRTVYTEVRYCMTCGFSYTDSYYYEEDAEECLRYAYHTVTLMMDEEEVARLDYVSTSENHAYETKAELKEGSADCEDGVTITTTCKNCDYHDSYLTYGHRTVTVKEYDISEYGGCDDSIISYSVCACGKESYFDNYPDGCYMDYTSNSYKDEEGKMVYVETRVCMACGLRMTDSYYYETVADSCVRLVHHTVDLSIGTTLIDQFAFTKKETQHDYDVHGTLDEGATSCEDGATLTYTCSVCGYSYTSHVSWHETFAVEVFDLEKYGSVCGGTAKYRVCACGEASSFDFSDALCDFDGNWDYNVSVEGAIKDYWGHPTTDGEYTGIYDPEAYVYTCAVTDPERCPLVIRRLIYWVDAGNCMADRYYKWQIGYNRETDTALYELTYKVESCQYHAYKTTSIDEPDAYGTQGVCSDCGATFVRKTYHNSDGYTTKYELIVTNPLDNGRNKRYERVYENIEVGGYWEESLHYEEYTYADGEVHWSRRVHSYDLANCVKTTTYTYSDFSSSTSTYEHWRTDYVNIKNSTCTQDGAYGYRCVHCQTETNTYIDYADGHNWENVGDIYRCRRCGLENVNGADGDIIFEDLTEEYGNGTSYVAGYYCESHVSFTYYVSLILHTPKENGDDEVVLSEISFTELENMRAISFLKSDVESAAEALGYSADEYDVRFAFVPYGMDGSLDYAITFTD